MQKNKLDLKKLIIYDIETLANCYVGNFYDYATGGKKTFIFYNDKKYAEEPLNFFKFLKSCVNRGYTFLGFNVLGFDAQILHDFYESCQNDELYNFKLSDIIASIYNKAQAIIECQNDRNKLYEITTPEYKLFAPHIDLYKQLHYDSVAKKTSLKWLEFTMRYHTIEEMPIHHSTNITLDDIQTVVDYCWNDVLATVQFFEKVKFETETRKALCEEFDLPLINSSEPDMVRKIFGKFLSEEMGITYAELKKLKTIRNKVKFKDIILPYIKFQTPYFKDIYNVFYNAEVDASPNGKAEFEYTPLFQDAKIVLALGGIHSCAKSGVYEPDVGEEILDLDVKN